MATYVLPQVQVFQDFNLRPENEIQPLYTLVTGGHAVLYRYSQSDEKSQVLLGTYDHVGTSIDGVFKTCYSWPEKPSSALIDNSYTKLYIDDALLRYWTDTSDTMVKTDTNKIRHPSKSFITNPAAASTYPRHADFLDRDVQVGDVVRVTGSSDSGTTTYDLCTYVKEIEADQSAASVGTATAVSGNRATSMGVSNATASTSNTGTVAAPSIDGTGFSGLADGVAIETYTVTVTQASTGGDHTTARLRITSASGLDDVSEATPSAATTPTDIGTRGLIVTFPAGNFAVGDVYILMTVQAFTATTATSGGTYIGTADKTYIIEVTKGGDYAESPEITVTTTDGTDFSGPHVVSDIYGGVTTTSTTTAAPSSECQTEAISIGTLGVTICFSGYGLSKGDRFKIVATAPANTTYRTLVLGHDLDDLIPEDDASTAVLDVALYIKKDIEVSEKHVSIAGNYNWDQSDTQFCARAGITAYDSTWTSSGTPVALPVIKDDVCVGTNQMYVEYRAWDQTLTASVGAIDDVADLDTAISGPLTPDNPLKWAMFKALSNNNGQLVRYISVSNPDTTSAWSTVLDKIADRPDVYNLVPLTYDKTVLDLFQAHVQAQSTETIGRWRVLWVNLQDSSAKTVADATTEGELVLATTEDDPTTSGTQYTLMKGTAGKGFFANARAGDVVRYKYVVDAWGDSSYSEYVIAAVLNEDMVRLESGTASAESTPIKAEVHRTLTADEQAAELGLTRGYSDRRVRATWPDRISSGGTEMDGVHLNAALASLTSGVVPHQGLTHLAINGFDNVDRTIKEFNRSQLDTMAGAGVWIVTQSESGEIFSRHAVTTGDNSIITDREEQIVRNVDSISFYFFDTFAPYIGVANATDGMLDIIESETLAAIQFLRRRGETTRLGGQLTDATITDLRVSLEFKDRILLGLSLNIPVALNNIEIHLLV